MSDHKTCQITNMDMIFPVTFARSRPVTLENLSMRKLIEEFVSAFLLRGLLKQKKIESHTKPSHSKHWLG